jgi:hypothetical protein
MKEFETVEVTHVPREQNTRADILSKLVSTRTANGNKTIIQEALSEPSIQDRGTLPLEINVIIGMEDWRGPISRYIENGYKKKASSFP